MENIQIIIVSINYNHVNSYGILFCIEKNAD